MIRLNGGNWMIWKSIMKDLLCCKDLYAPFESDDLKPKNMSDGEWKKSDRKVVGFIRQWLDDSIFNHVSTVNIFFMD